MICYRMSMCAGIVLLSACGGGSGGGSGADEDFDALVARAEALFDAEEAVDGQATPVADLPPDTGSVTYTGIAVYIGAEATSAAPIVFGALGEFTGEADFRNETFTGTADDFIEITNAEAVFDDDADPIGGGRVDGSFTVDMEFDSFDEGGIERSSLIGEIDGRITHSDNSTQVYDGMEADGGFLGPAAELVEVIGAGTSNTGLVGAVSIIGSQ